MTPFKKGRNLQIYVSSRSGYRQRSTGTSNPSEARKIARMCQALKDDQRWEILDSILDGELSLRRAYAAYSGNRLGELAAELAGTDLSSHLDGWQGWVNARRGTTQTSATYRAQVETLVVHPFASNELSAKRVSEWLTTLPKVTTGTRRKYLYALKSFVKYLLEVGVIETDPLVAIGSPKKNPPRLRWETEANDVRIVEAAPAECRALFAFIKATGAEVSAALLTVRRDLDLGQGLAHIRGSKNEKRNRHDCVIEPWAIPILDAHLRRIARSQLPVDSALVWPGLTRYQAHYHHQATCKALGIDDYTLRDARHSWSVRARKRGESLEAIAEQLGHKNIYQAATVYAVFKPTIEERRSGPLELKRRNS